MTGRSLKKVIESDLPVRETGIFGVNGGQLNITDGRYVYSNNTVYVVDPATYAITRILTGR